MAPNKGYSLAARMNHAFGRLHVHRVFQMMLAHNRANLINFLTDEAREELLRLCITEHKNSRRSAAESRAHYRKTEAAR